ncbi:hypothetical protein KFU94_10415 [Chloroflexi bacterium TSY]|nr:hypothetical protein [Chloroflexi bacterium TSY]
MVEIELSVITRQVLDRRIDSKELLETVVLALVNERNEQSATIQWQFTPRSRSPEVPAFLSCFGYRF